MKFPPHIFLSLLLLACNTRVNPGGANGAAAQQDTIPGQAATTPARVKPRSDTVPKDPDARAEAAKMFAYFERHKAENAFDTADNTFANWWGLWASSINCVVAGHIFNNRQVHAVIYYSIAEDTGALVVLLKTPGGWGEIYKNTVLPAYLRLSFKDWNNDGTKDLSLHVVPPGLHDFETYSVILCDRLGTKMHQVREFEELRNPEMDKATGHIVTEDEYHTTEELDEYCFREYRLTQLRAVIISPKWDDNTGEDIHGNLTVEFLRNSKTYSSHAVKESGLCRILPPLFQKRSLHCGKQGPESAND